jgi:hypothetical protein
MSDESFVYVWLLLVIAICLVQSFFQSSEANTDFVESFRAAVDWYSLSGVGDIIRDAITNDFAAATEFSEGNLERLLSIIKDARARTWPFFVISCDLSRLL